MRWTERPMQTALLGACLLAWSLPGKAAEKPPNLVRNPGFEAEGLTNDSLSSAEFRYSVPGWGVKLNPQFQLLEGDAHSGNRCLRSVDCGPRTMRNFSTCFHEDSDARVAMESGGKGMEIPILPGAWYRLEFWARGKGTLKPLIVFYRHATYAGSAAAATNQTKHIDLKPDWTKYEFVVATDPAATYNQAGVCFWDWQAQPGDAFDLDDVYFGYAPGQGEQVERFHQPSRAIRLRAAVEGPGTIEAVSASGCPMAPEAPGCWSGHISGGLSHIVLTLKGKEQGGRLRLPGAFEVENDETIPFAGGGWLLTADDREAFSAGAMAPGQWSQPAATTNGAEFEIKPGQTLFLRRTLYWAGHRDPFLFPKGPVFYMPKQSIATLTLVLQPVAPVAARETAAVEFEIPAEMEWVDKTGGTDFFMNCLPSRITTNQIESNGALYRCYRLDYPDKPFTSKPFFMGGGYWITPWMTPLFFTSRSGPVSGDRWVRFRRVFRQGNLTELWQQMPVVFLPKPVRGNPRQFVTTLHSGCLWHPWDYTHTAFYSPAERALALRSFNAVMPCIFWPKLPPENPLSMLPELNKLNARYALPPPINLNVGRSWELPEWGMFFHENPEFRQSGYKGSEEAVFEGGGDPRDAALIRPGKYHAYNGFCLSYLAASGQEAWRRFESAVAETKKNWPRAEFAHEEAHTEFGSFSCFCPRCKEAFARFSGIEGAAGLSDEEIARKHFKAYKQFLVHAVWELRKKKREILNRHGIKYFLHDEGRMLFDGQLVQWAMVGACDTLDNNGDMIAEPTEELFGWLKAANSSIGGAQYGWYTEDPRIWRVFLVKAAAYGRCGVYKFETAAEAVAALGSLYFISEATRFIERFEPFLLEGTYARHRLLESSAPGLEITGSFERKGRKLVLVFNHTRNDLATTLRYIGNRPLRRVEVTSITGPVANPSSLEVTVPAVAVIAVVLREAP